MAYINTKPIQIQFNHGGKTIIIKSIDLADKVALKITDSNGQLVSLDKQYLVKKEHFGDQEPWTHSSTLQGLRPVDELVKIVKSDFKNGLLP